MRVHSDHERVSIEIETAMAGGRICATVVMPRAGIFCMPAFVYSEAVSRSVLLKLHATFRAFNNFCHLNDRHLVASCETAPPAELFLSLVLDESHVHGHPFLHRHLQDGTCMESGSKLAETEKMQAPIHT